MHTFDKLLYEVLEPHLCDDMIGVILEKCSKYRKEVRRAEQKKPFCGTSKKAIRRRERRYNACHKCGKNLYDHRTCDMEGNIDNFGMTYLIRNGPVAVENDQTLNSMWGMPPFLVIARQENYRIRALGIKSLKNSLPSPYRSWNYYQWL